jgi:hypothetical protein
MLDPPEPLFETISNPTLHPQKTTLAGRSTRPILPFSLHSHPYLPKPQPDASTGLPAYPKKKPPPPLFTGTREALFFGPVLN